MPLVDDADRQEQHARANVERSRKQEIDVRLLELDLTARLEPLDERMFHLQFADESNPVGKPVRHQQHEAMEIQPAIHELFIVVVKVHEPDRAVSGQSSAGNATVAGAARRRRREARRRRWLAQKSI